MNICRMPLFSQKMKENQRLFDTVRRQKSNPEIQQSFGKLNETILIHRLLTGFCFRIEKTNERGQRQRALKQRQQHQQPGHLKQQPDFDLFRSF